MKTFFKPLVTVFALAITVSGFAQAEIPNDLRVDDSAVPAKFDTNVYIVQMKEDPAVAYEGGIGRYKATKPQQGKKINPNSRAVRAYVAYLDSRHDDVLAAIGAGEKIYDYRFALNGFAAVLTPDQVKAVRARDDVVQVWRDELRQLNTDSTPDYLGVRGGGGVWETQGKGEDVIVGMLDTGVWPEHQSFSDQNDLSDVSGSSGERNLAYGPPPSDWHGTCQSGEQWSQDDCNNKVIGARYFHAGFGRGNSGLGKSEILSARDTNGHGSHTASTAAGNEGANNSIDGDPVSGVAPRARLAIYKVCWNDRFGSGGCASSDSAAATDAAVADGVDVINFSIGGPSTSFGGADDIAFLFAADAGVWVATSNGNAGPGAQTTGTPAGVPWITAVGNTQDNEVFSLRLIVSGDLDDSYLAIEGASPVLFDADVSGTMIPADPHDGCSAFNNDIGGQIALVIRGVCSFSLKYNNAAAAGASAIIVYNDGTAADRIDPITMGAPGTNIPGAMIGFFDGDLINTTVGGGGNVSGTIGPATAVSEDNRIANLSSRGPNGGAPDVIKPDVAAPGTRIIAAGAGTGSIRISGTSMASPHVAGTFALLKEAHPDWSAAMAKSAVMTSARQNLKKTFGDTDADPFDIGAGHIVPAGAFEPGLVYDAGFVDYLRFLCGSDFQSQLVSPAGCAFFGSIDSSDLNLASIGVAALVGTQTVTRTVKSVTPGMARFKASIVAPPGIDVTVSPARFKLSHGESKTVEIQLSVNGDAVFDQWTFGSLTWGNKKGASPARSPIAVKPVQLDAPPQVNGSGMAGSLSFDIGFGYDGDYSAGTHGLVPALREAGTVVDDPANDINTALDTGVGVTFHGVVVPAGTDITRFSLFDADTDGNDDLDLYIFGPDTAGFPFRGGSGSPTSAEQVQIASPEAGFYFAVVHGWQTDGADSNYFLSSWTPGADAGNMVVTAPAAAILGFDTIDVDWNGLDAGIKYLGSVSHSDADGKLGQTVISISTE